jgi:regulator of RNase E activity RraA
MSVNYLGATYDALRLVMGESAKSQYINIKPTAGYKSSQGIVEGPVFTTRGRTVTSSEAIRPGAYEQLDNIRMGIYKDFQDFFENCKPVVCLEAADNKVAHTGDITSMIYQKMGSVGMLTDGITRDASVIDEIGYPVFAKDANPIDAIDHWAITEYSCSIEIEGVAIEMGDWVVMDSDGAIVVPNKHFLEWKAERVSVLDREAFVRGLIRDGNLSLQEILDEMGRW